MNEVALYYVLMSYRQQELLPPPPPPSPCSTCLIEDGPRLVTPASSLTLLWQLPITPQVLDNNIIITTECY